jgi:hypothetical protein
VGILIEAHSRIRFDIYMRTKVLQPIGINASYNLQDINDIGNLAVIYRKGIGNADDLNGTMPKPTDFSLYKLGTNAFSFGP